jgi:hypothetical protein
MSPLWSKEVTHIAKCNKFGKGIAEPKKLIRIMPSEDK